jgi:hypothetical protein
MARKNQPDIQDEWRAETSSQRILLEEYRLLQSRFLDLQNEGLTRMNFFITAASVSIGSFLVFGSNNLSELYFKIILLIIVALLSMIDIYICRFFISREIAVDRYERGLARIRNYFVRIDADLKDYFVTKIFDVPTGNIKGNNSGMRQSAQLIGAFLLGLEGSILMTFTSLFVEIDILTGFVIAILAFSILEWNAQRRFKKVVEAVETEMKFKEKSNAK